MFGCIPEPVLGRIAVSVSGWPGSLLMCYCKFTCNYLMFPLMCSKDMKELLDEGQSQVS